MLASADMVDCSDGDKALAGSFDGDGELADSPDCDGVLTASSDDDEEGVGLKEDREKLDADEAGDCTGELLREFSMLSVLVKQGGYSRR